METPLLFFSDVHLSVGRPRLLAQMLSFLDSGEFRDARTVYILGDLFDLWIGPKHLDLPDYQEVLEALRTRTKSGQAINFIYGNRDFLVDKTFTKATGVKVLGDSADLVINGKKVWLTHGDLLCTRDRGYRSYRRIARSQLIKSAYRSIPQKASYGLGQGLRGLSRHLVGQKPEPERTITPEAVESAFKKGYDVIICGHIHKAHQETQLGGKQLFTLGAFGEGGHYLVYQDGLFKAKRFEPASSAGRRRGDL